MVEIYNRKEKYEALSLVEMLITLVIIGIVLLVVSATLIALIKASAISSARTLSRDDSEYIFEYVQKYIKNSQIDNIKLYKVSTVSLASWGVNEDGSVTAPETVQLIEMDPDEEDALDFNATQLHVKPIGSDNWLCIGFIPGMPGSSLEGKGFIAKSVQEQQSPRCLLDANRRVFLNSDEIDVNLFQINAFTGITDNVNFIIDLELEPVHWIPGERSAFVPQYYRQLVVSTSKLIY